MRISDWSSDVCSSDLQVDLRLAAQFEKNSPEQNRADARFEQFQLAIDKRVATATERGASKEQLAQIVESAKAHVAATFREGKSPNQAAEKSKDRERCKWTDRQSDAEGNSVSVRVDLGGRRRSTKKTSKEK